MDLDALPAPDDRFSDAPQAALCVIETIAARYPGGAVVALSGGADSALLLDLAVEAYGASRVVAATSRSESLPADELVLARSQAARLGVEHVAFEGSELDLEGFRRNGPDRCFHCKRALYGEMRGLATERGLAHVLDGTNADDTGDHRPGLAAAQEQRVGSPLLDAGLTKAWVRTVSRFRGLETWDKPAEACLSSRFPYGTPVTREGLSRVERAERALKSLGFGTVRVRVHDPVARIEVPLDEVQRMLAPGVRERIVDALRGCGFDYVSVDLEGFRSGSLNEPLRRSRG